MEDFVTSVLALMIFMGALSGTFCVAFFMEWLSRAIKEARAWPSAPRGKPTLRTKTRR